MPLNPMLPPGRPRDVAAARRRPLSLEVLARAQRQQAYTRDAVLYARGYGIEPAHAENAYRDHLRACRVYQLMTSRSLPLPEAEAIAAEEDAAGRFGPTCYAVAVGMVPPTVAG